MNLSPFNLQGALPQKAEQYILALSQVVQGIQAKLDSTSSSFITPSQLSSTLQSFAQSIQANGSSPINVTNLSGVLSQPQLAGIPTVTSLPDLSDPLSQPNAVVLFHHQLYVFNASVSPPQWQPALISVLVGTHAERLAYDITGFNDGLVWYETDRTTAYLLISGIWNWVFGRMYGRDEFSSPPTDLLTTDAGFEFEPVSTGSTMRWSGQYWTVQTELGVQVFGVRSNRMASINGGTCSVTSGVMTITGGGINMDAGWNNRPTLLDLSFSGTVNTNGTAVHLTAGSNFDASYVNHLITINGVEYLVSSVAGTSDLTLATSAGVQAGVAYSIRYPMICRPYPVLTATTATLIPAPPNVAGVTFFYYGDSASYYREGVCYYESDSDLTYRCYPGVGTLNSGGADNTATWASGDPVPVSAFGQTITIAMTASATVNTNGTTVTWSAGTKFSSKWVGQGLTINAVTCIVQSVDSTGTTMTVDQNLGVNAGVALSSTSIGLRIRYTLDHVDGLVLHFTEPLPYALVLASFSISNLKWVYFAGTMIGSVSSPPLSLGANDKGMLFRDNTYRHTWKYDGGSWDFADGDRSGIIVMTYDGNRPNGGDANSHAPCDGNPYTICNSTLGTTNATTPALTLDVFIRGSATQTPGGTPITENSPTWQAGSKTDDESAHTHTVTDTINVTTGVAANNAVSSQVTSAGSAHHHNLSNANAVINPPNETNGGLPRRISMTFWMRR